ncbi:MAG: hypothetical protein IK093_17760 [Ruminiclostridium sp.]|nr:hypothetical protein [Ruminiclostridium sp.]
MINADDFIAIEQYKKYGRIIPCRECNNYKAQSGTKGYGICSVLGRMMKENEYCCYGKEKPVEDDIVYPMDAGDRDYSGLLDE